MTTSYKIEGMTCGGCVKSVTNAIERAAPGLKFEVSLEQAAVKVEGEHRLETIQQAVEDAGFDFSTLS